ncbi:Spx/MgsR family RNA polymerase-binding regulatory protein [Neisseria bacilliformis]|uniref:Spx/MgsR family RNA polymerase-binding regulatory protein n=1 Tax=Neisseria bacilliformis TaxID=267212 RepID=UPI0028EF8741|nr:Spx/MgsR family RNA polymerase-binding regulatory protein [Neisseria bacilliformis]
MTVLYGIPNCDSVKKARAYLAAHGADYTFCDFKKTPPTTAQLEAWLADIPLDTLLNRRGTTWRKLTPEQQAQAQEPAAALALMAAQPSLIKRPVLEHGGRFYCGFQTALYEQLFGAGG